MPTLTMAEANFVLKIKDKVLKMEALLAEYRRLEKEVSGITESIGDTGDFTTSHGEQIVCDLWGPELKHQFQLEHNLCHD
jgi:hypothetical protein